MTDSGPRHEDVDVDLEPMGDDDEFTDPADGDRVHEDVDPEAVADELGLDSGHASGDDELAYEPDEVD